MVRKVGSLKKKEGLAVHDRVREEEILERVGRITGRTDAGRYVRDVFRALFRVSRAEEGEGHDGND